MNNLRIVDNLATGVVDRAVRDLVRIQSFRGFFKCKIHERFFCQTQPLVAVGVARSGCAKTLVGKPFRLIKRRA